ncbi:MAG: SDR family oxidoreductase [Myxococcota bacterium]|jgi:uncharacterized protein|nr:SDR family oxidoreductase [Myxococcota bacterium]
MKHQTALITGAGGGLGLEFARLLAEQGWNLVLAGRTEQKLAEAAQELENVTSGRVTYIQVDLSEAGSAQRLYSQVCESGELIELLINNAGVGVFGEHVKLPAEKLSAMLTLNIMNLTLLSQSFAADMKERGHGYLLNIASTASFQPVPLFSAYAASKSYVLHFSEALAKELEDYGVKVSCLCPGHTESNFFEQAGIADSEKGFFSPRARMKPGQVARVGLNAVFEGKLTVIPGFRNNALVFANRLTTRPLAAMISKRLTANP